MARTMPAPARCPPELVATAHELADAAGAVVRRHFRTPMEVDEKDDVSPVTAADREAERAVRDLLARRRPDDGVVGEELGEDRPGAGVVWVVDPIDGTGSFIAGRPMFGTLIAATAGGVPFLGVIDQPVSGERWIAGRGLGTRLGGAPVRTRPCAGLGECVLATTSPRLFTPDGHERFAAVEGAARRTLFGGDCYNYALLATGMVDLVVESGLKPHDFCALAPVVAEAGGVISDWSGRPVGIGSGGDIVAAGDPRVHREALALLGG